MYDRYKGTYNNGESAFRKAQTHLEQQRTTSQPATTSVQVLRLHRTHLRVGGLTTTQGVKEDIKWYQFTNTHHHHGEDTKTPHQETSSKWCTFDIVVWIRARRLQWVGHILRMGKERKIKYTVFELFKKPFEGNLLMDVSAVDS